MSDHRRALAALARFVPPEKRREWLQEWHAEMSQPQNDSWRRLLDAVEDAVRLRLRRLAPRRLGGWLRACGHDLRWAWRALNRRPAFALTVVLVLAVAIGTAVMTFSLVDAVLLRPLPYRDPQGIVLLWADGSTRGLGLRAGQPPADILEWRDETTSFVDIAALRNSSYGLTDLPEPMSPLTHEVTDNYFDVLGVSPAMGRAFEAGDADDRLVIVSHRLWRDFLGADAGVVGRTLQLDGVGYRVIGVLPAEFWSSHILPTQPELWVPISFAGAEGDRRDRRHAVFARLRDGVTLAQAQAEMDGLAARREQAFPDTHRGWGVEVVTVRDNAVGPLQPAFVVAMAAALLVLVIACANVAGLTVARSAQRQREIALRAAIGASQGRVARQLMLESAMVVAAAGLVGCLFAWLSTPWLVSLLPGIGSTTAGSGAAVPFLDRVGLDARVLAFATALTALAALTTGVWPARLARGSNLAAAIAGAGRGSCAGVDGGRVRRTLVAAETGLAVMLTVGAMLMVRTVTAQYSVHLGFDADRVLTLRNSLRGPEFAGPDAWREHFRRAVHELKNIPGVEAAGAANFPPPEFANGAVPMRIAGTPSDPATDVPGLPRLFVPGYFEALGIARLRGRLPDAGDRRGTVPVLAINTALARRLFGEGDPLGQRVAFDVAGISRPASRELGQVEWEVVGVVDDVRSGGDDPTPQPIFYVQHDQLPQPIMNLMVRAAPGIAPASLARVATETVWSLSRSMNIYNVEPLDLRLGNLLWQARFALRVLSALAAIALLLGMTGLYAVLSYGVTQRGRELGVRMALGARRDDVLSLVVRDGLKLAGLGVAAGVLGSLLLGGLLDSLLFGVSAHDPTTLSTVAVTVVAVAAVACMLPAWRATRVDPVRVLRSE